MTLSIDIGNTRSKLGIFEQGEMRYKAIFEVLSAENLAAVLSNHSIQNCIYSTVAGIDEAAKAWLNTSFPVIELTDKSRLPFKNKYKTPKTLGKDRLAAVAGALRLYPKTNCLVIDAGTCITYDVLTEKAHYLGGNIAPGLQMRLKAMHEFTDALPLAPLAPVRTPIGKSTEHALQNGGLWGAVLEMQGVIDWCITEFGSINVILTGGDANFFANHLKREIFVHQNLVLIGLEKILEHNVKTSQ